MNNLLIKIKNIIITYLVSLVSVVKNAINMKVPNLNQKFKLAV